MATKQSKTGKNPQTITIYGRLSFPVFSHAAAVERNKTSDYPQSDPMKVAPEFNLVVEQPQLDKLRAHVLNVFLPWVKENGLKGEKRNGLEADDVKFLEEAVIAGDWGNKRNPNMPFKAVPEKTIELAPEGVAMIKVIGTKGQDVMLKAIVNSEDELAVPDPDLLTFPVIKPIGQTTHTMYAGAYVAATLNLYAYLNGKVPGFSASAGVAVFKADADQFGGGVAVDEEEMFLD